MKWHGGLVAIILLAGCADPEPPPFRPLAGLTARQILQARAALRDATERYALAKTPEQVRACLPALEKIAQDRRHPGLAARARFVTAHAHGYVLKDTHTAIQQFHQVIEIAPAELAALAAEQIEALRKHKRGNAP